jgi:hypothetical protein
MTNHDDKPFRRQRNETSPTLLISAASTPLLIIGALWVLG